MSASAFSSDKVTKDVTAAYTKTRLRVTRRLEIYEADATTLWTANEVTHRMVDGSINVTSGTSERRTFDMTLDNKDKGLKHNPDGGFWYDKIIKVFRGLVYTGKIADTYESNILRTPYDSVGAGVTSTYFSTYITAGAGGSIKGTGTTYRGRPVIRVQVDTPPAANITFGVVAPYRVQCPDGALVFFSADVYVPASFNADTISCIMRDQSKLVSNPGVFTHPNGGSSAAQAIKGRDGWYRYFWQFKTNVGNAIDYVYLFKGEYNLNLNLVSNGTGNFGNITNFAGATYSSTDKPAVMTGTTGSFSYPAGSRTASVTDAIPVDINKTYELSFHHRQLAGSGRFYGGVWPHDADGLIISPQHYMEQANTRTTLAVALNPGDTTITLTSSLNWKARQGEAVAGASTHLRSITFWDWTDGKGKTWAPGTYSRNAYLNVYDDGQIIGNVINLRVPWAGPAKAAGVSVGNSSSGGSFLYIAASNLLGTTTWTDALVGRVSGIHTDNTLAATTSFPIATVSVKPSWLLNYTVPPLDPASQQAIANVKFIEVREQKPGDYIDTTRWMVSATTRPEEYFDGATKSSEDVKYSWEGVVGNSISRRTQMVDTDKYYEAQVGEFMIDSIDTKRFPNQISVSGRDYTKKLMLDQFAVDTAFAANSKLDDIVRIVATVAGIKKFRLNATGVTIGPQSTFARQTSRWDALSGLAESLNVELYFDAQGYLCTRLYQDVSTAAPSYILNAEGAAANIVDFGKVSSDSNIFNHIVVTGTSEEETVTGYKYIAIRENRDPNSPTNISRIGRRTMAYEVDYLTSQKDADALADRMLSIMQLEDFTLSFSSVCLPWLEVGRVLQFSDPDEASDSVPTRFLFSDFSIPMKLGPMSGSGKRILVAGTVSDETEN